MIIFSLCSTVGHSQTNKINDDKFLIVLDVQEGYTKNLDQANVPIFINSVNTVIKNTNPDKVIYVNSLHKALEISFKGFKVDTLVKAIPDSNLIIVNESLYIKDQGDAFSLDSLCEFLKINNATDIIVCGLLAEKCVSSTLLEGQKLGYNMYVIPDAIIGKSEEKKNKVIDKLSKKGIIKVELSDYINR